MRVRRLRNDRQVPHPVADRRREPARQVGVLLLTALAACPCGSHAGGDRPPAAPAGSFSIPRSQGPVIIDGKGDERSWQSAFRSPVFQDTGGRAVPFTELRATADDQFLYLEVYVGDIDIESVGDVVKLDVGPVHVELTPKGATAPAGVRTAVDTEDTVDNPKDMDEEWVNEVAIPWSMLGSHEVPVRALRIDVGHGDRPHALAWPLAAPALLRFDAEAGSGR